MSDEAESKKVVMEWENGKRLSDQFRIVPVRVKPQCLQGFRAIGLPSRVSTSPFFPCRVERTWQEAGAAGDSPKLSPTRHYWGEFCGRVTGLG